MSAALLTPALAEESPWIATEWHGAFVVEESLLDLLADDARRWSAKALGHRNLVILRPREHRVPGPRHGETAAEYGASLDDDRPFVAHTTLDAVQRERRVWFGELNDPLVGGANALLSLSGATPSSTSILLRNPAALGLSRVAADSSLFAQRRGQRIFVQSVGAPRTQSWEDEIGADYEVLLEISAPVDPEIEVDLGVVFEQSALNNVQTLAAAQSRRVVVPAGAMVPLGVPAWCLNRDLRAPGGEPVSITPFRIRVDESSQGAVWAERQRVLEATA